MVLHTHSSTQPMISLNLGPNCTLSTLCYSVGQLKYAHEGLKFLFQTKYISRWRRTDATNHTDLWSGHPRQGLVVVNFLVRSLFLGEGLVTQTSWPSLLVNHYPVCNNYNLFLMLASSQPTILQRQSRIQFSENEEFIPFLYNSTLILIQHIQDL